MAISRREGASDLSDGVDGDAAGGRHVEPGYGFDLVMGGLIRFGGLRNDAGSPRMMVTLPHDYRPSDDEPFMNPLQVEYFRQKLERWRSDLISDADVTLASLSEGGIHEADITDRASVETDRALELRTRDRARKLIAKIDQALSRIENGSYGYCEESGEPIGLRRLEARPIATLSIEAQERHERMERVHRDD